MGVLHNIPTWKDAGVQTEPEDNEEMEPGISVGLEHGQGGANHAGTQTEPTGILRDDYDSEVHQAEDPREVNTICISVLGLPRLAQDDHILLQIPQPKP